MKAIHLALLVSVSAALCPGQENSAHKNELAFTLGGLPSLSQGGTPSIDLGSGLALQVNYGRRLLNGGLVALYGEVHLLASPLRSVSTSISTATRDVATLYITPGIRVKLLPSSPISPYFAAGGGYADYEQSTTRIDGAPNQAPRQLGRGAFDVGAGIDGHLWRFVAVRVEARDFFTGKPNYNISTITGGQNNVVVGGGLVLRWH